jgi:hypothetical protein
MAMKSWFVTAKGNCSKPIDNTTRLFDGKIEEPKR